MSENRASGPFVGQIVTYILTAGTGYPGMIVAIDQTTGLVEILTFQSGGTIGDRTSVLYDPAGITANSWHYPQIITGI